MTVPESRVLRPRQTTQMHRLLGSLNGCGQLSPWQTCVIDARETETAETIKWHLTRSWSISGYWTARERKASGSE